MEEKTSAEQKPSYYSITPASVRYANIPPNAKLLYGEITALASREGYCYANNKYFSKLYGVHAGTVSAWIRVLADHGFIRVELENSFLRRIYIAESAVKKPKAPLHKNIGGVHEKLKGGTRKAEGGVHEKLNHSITTSTTSNIRTKSEALVLRSSTIGDEQINKNLKLWATKIGYELKNSAQNRRAIANLIKSKGDGWIASTLDTLAKAKADRFSGIKIANFYELQRDYERVLAWQASSTQVSTQKPLTQDEKDLAMAKAMHCSLEDIRRSRL